LKFLFCPLHNLIRGTPNSQSSPFRWKIDSFRFHSIEFLSFPEHLSHSFFFLSSRSTLGAFGDPQVSPVRSVYSCLYFDVYDLWVSSKSFGASNSLGKSSFHSIKRRGPPGFFCLFFHSLLVPVLPVPLLLCTLLFGRSYSAFFFYVAVRLLFFTCLTSSMMPFNSIFFPPLRSVMMVPSQARPRSGNLRGSLVRSQVSTNFFSLRHKRAPQCFLSPDAESKMLFVFFCHT